MKKLVKIVLTTIAISGVITAQEPTVNWLQKDTKDAQVKQERKDIDESVAKSKILMVEAKKTAKETIASLHKNFLFLERVLNNKSYRDCVAVEGYIADIQKDRIVAKRLLNSNKITKKQYQGYMNKLDVKEVGFRKELKNVCKTK